MQSSSSGWPGISPNQHGHVPCFALPEQFNEAAGSSHGQVIAAAAAAAAAAAVVKASPTAHFLAAVPKMSEGALH
jgi:hypothetical protein